MNETITFGDFSTLDSLVRHSIGTVSALFLLVFAISALIMVCFKPYMNSKKEKVVFLLSVFSTFFWAYYHFYYRKAALWQLATILKVLQVMLIAFLLLESSIPHIYSLGKTRKISVLFVLVFALYAVSQVYLTDYYEFTLEVMECVSLIRLIPASITFAVSNLYLLWSLYMCYQGGTVENLMRSTIILQSFSSNEVKSLADTGYSQKRKAIKGFVWILYIDLFVFIFIEVLLGILANTPCILTTSSKDHNTFFISLVPISIWLVDYIVRETSIYYIFFWSCVGQSTNLIVPEDNEQSLRSSLIIREV